MTTTDAHHRPTSAADDARTPPPATAVAPADATAERRLRRALRADAVVSLASGLALAIAPERLDDLLGTGRPGWVRVVGLAFLVYAVDVALVAAADRRRLRMLAPAIVAANAVYVVASIVAVLAGWFDGAGIAAVIAGAVAIDVLGFVQFRSWRAMRSARSPRSAGSAAPFPR